MDLEKIKEDYKRLLRLQELNRKLLESLKKVEESYQKLKEFLEEVYLKH